MWRCERAVSRNSTGSCQLWTTVLARFYRMLFSEQKGVRQVASMTNGDQIVLANLRCFRVNDRCLFKLLDDPDEPVSGLADETSTPGRRALRKDNFAGVQLKAFCGTPCDRRMRSSICALRFEQCCGDQIPAAAYDIGNSGIRDSVERAQEIHFV